MNSPHKCIVIGDDRPGTPEILEKRIDSWDRRIANWKPPTVWEAANQRHFTSHENLA